MPRVCAGESIHSKPFRREKQIADRVGRLHRRNHTELGEARNVRRIDNLRVLNSPARFFDFSLIRRHRFECGFVKIENLSVRAIADCVRLNLDPATQRLFEHWPQLFRFFSEIAGSFGRIVIWLQQRRAA